MGESNINGKGHLDRNRQSCTAQSHANSPILNSGHPLVAGIKVTSFCCFLLLLCVFLILSEDMPYNNNETTS